MMARPTLKLDIRATYRPSHVEYFPSINPKAKAYYSPYTHRRSRSNPPPLSTVWRIATRYSIVFSFIAAWVYLLSISPVRLIPFYGTYNIQLRKHDDPWKARAQQVKDAFVHAYRAYEHLGFPFDEVRPLSKQPHDPFNGWAVTAIDSLDTMHLMGLRDEYERTIRHIATLDFKSHPQPIPFFETVIRYLGGFLSAWHMTGDSVLLEKADELGMALLPAFNTTSGLPQYFASSPGHTTSGSSTIKLAEAASFQVEYKYLAFVTGRKEFFHVAERVNDILNATQDPESHLWPLTLSTQDRQDQIRLPSYSVGSTGDSAYEYLLKQYLLSGKTEHKLLDLYLSAIRGITSHLLYYSPARDLIYVTELATRPLKSEPNYVSTQPLYTMDHLSCFLPGVLALGAHSLNDDELAPEERDVHMAIAKSLARTCYTTYADMPSGLGPEIFVFGRDSRPWLEVYNEWMNGSGETVAPGLSVTVEPRLDPGTRGYTVLDSRWLARPETIESLFVLYRVTGESIWRERAYEIFKAIQKWSRQPLGYSSIENVEVIPPAPLDEMPSYFLAETLKYLYVLFNDDPSVMSLDEFVLNTEAHPLPKFRWSDAEMNNYGIKPAPKQASRLRDTLRSQQSLHNSSL